MPRDYFVPLDLREVFARDAPLEVDIGCGDGAYLAAIAEQNRQRNFLGVERLVGRVRSACRKMAQRQLDNARILLIDASYAVKYLLPRQSVTAFHVLFPDPWPKRRHERRRLITCDFARALHCTLELGGSVTIATDDANYFEQITQTFVSTQLFGSTRLNSESPVPSTFQKKFAGGAIYRLVLRKVSPPR